MHLDDRLRQAVAGPVRRLRGPGQTRPALQDFQQLPGGERRETARGGPLLLDGDVEGAPAAGDPLSRGAGRLDGLDFGVPGGMLGRLSGAHGPFGRFDLGHHLPGVLTDGALQRRELGGLLGVPPAGG